MAKAPSAAKHRKIKSIGRGCSGLSVRIERRQFDGAGDMDGVP
jgi:hypothetical protein